MISLCQILIFAALSTDLFLKGRNSVVGIQFSAEVTGEAEQDQPNILQEIHQRGYKSTVLQYILNRHIMQDFSQ